MATYSKKKKQTISPGMSITPKGPGSLTGGQGPGTLTPIAPTPVQYETRVNYSRPAWQQTPGGKGLRTSADTALKGAKAGYNSNAYLAALNYGDLGLINQSAADTGNLTLGAAPEAGQLSQILRQQKANQKTAENSRNKAGTFFSTLMSGDTSQINTDASVAQTQAYNDYQAAKAALDQALVQANAAYQADMGQAEQMDWDYNNSLPSVESPYQVAVGGGNIPVPPGAGQPLGPQMATWKPPPAPKVSAGKLTPLKKKKKK